MIIKHRGCDIQADEIFISDGAKCDSGNIQEIFAADNKIAVCDPVYPVYVDTNVMAGQYRNLRCKDRDMEQCDLHALYKRDKFCTGASKRDTRYHLSVFPKQSDRVNNHKSTASGVGRLCK